MEVPSASISPPPTKEDMEEFYRRYDPMEGVITAVVLGGFFAFVCLLVLYKTKCKPMWKNRRKRLHNTPATHSMAETTNDSQFQQQANCHICDDDDDFADEMSQDVVPHHDDDDDDGELDDLVDDVEFEFECIPLKSVFNSGVPVAAAGASAAGSDNVDVESCGGIEGIEGIVQTTAVETVDEDNNDIFFLDECGNYVFPMSPPTANSCGSCQAAAAAGMTGDDHGHGRELLRRQSQVGVNYRVRHKHLCMTLKGL